MTNYDNTFHEEELKNTFTENLINFRRQAGYSKQEFADIINVNYSTYRSYETGRSMPSLFKVSQIAKIFKTSVDILLGVNNELDEPVKPMKLAAYQAGYNESIYTTKSLNELSNAEKIVVARFRQLNISDREKLEVFIDELLEKAELEKKAQE